MTPIYTTTDVRPYPRGLTLSARIGIPVWVLPIARSWRREVTS